MVKCCHPGGNDAFRKGAFFSAALSICPTCRSLVQGKILLRDGGVILRKRCPRHGSFESLLSTDAAYWTKSLSYTKPGQLPLKFSTRSAGWCPDDCGLCDEHEQHTCAPIIEITNTCDLQCPICIVWNRNTYEMTFAEFTAIVDGLKQKEGSLELALLSGGEPTLHPDLFRFADYAREQGCIKRVLVSSHGLRIARDDRFARQFKESGLYLSLQFDSFDDDHYEVLRGKRLLELKMKCLERCERYGIPTVLVPTVARGVNEGQIGKIVDYACSRDFITSVTIQPAAYTGAGGTAFTQNPLDKLTQPDIHRLLEEQTGWLRRQDFLPVPCSHPSCYSAAYVLQADAGINIPLTRFVNPELYLDALKNRAVISDGEEAQELVQDAIYSLWSAQAVTADSERVLHALEELLRAYNLCRQGVDNSDLGGIPEKRVKAIFVHCFMDEYDFETSRVQKCCTHYALSDGRLMPGCAYNTIHRFRDQRLGLDSITVPKRGTSGP